MTVVFSDLIVRQKSHKLVLKVYKITANFPKDEKYALSDDIRRAARSVPTNIVEGFRRKGVKEGLHFFNISQASLEELKYHTFLSFELRYIDLYTYKGLKNDEDEVGRILNGWIKSYCLNSN